MQNFLLILAFLSIVKAVDYSSEIQPIFNTNCTNCHNPSSSGWANHELDLTSYSGLMSGSQNGAMVIPGDANSSVLYDRIIRENSEQGDMPPGNSELDESEIALIEMWINEGSFEFESSCDEGFIEILDVPNNCIVFDQSSCFHEGDLQVLADIANLNEMLDVEPLYIGSQNWLNGRLKRIQVGNTFQGGNVSLTTLPQSISELDSLNTLQVDKNDLSSLPSEIGNLSRLQLLIASNNNLMSVPESINNLSQVWYLDLGYNALELIPDISNMNSLEYLYIFGNQISTISESICDLQLDWSGFDNSFMPYFACGGNQLCEGIPDCVANSDNFEIGLEANYYSFTIELLQDCEELSNLDQLPFEYILGNAYPNPFNPSAIITFSVPSFNYVSISVYDIRGNFVAMLVDDYYHPGSYSINLDGGSYSSGNYIVKMTSGDYQSTQIITLAK